MRNRKKRPLVSVAGNEKKTLTALIGTLILMLSCSVPAVLAGALPVTIPEAVGLSSERLSRIDTVLKADIDAGKIPGAVVLVARKGKIAYFKSFGMRDKEKGLSMKKDSIFRVYSMTKPLIGVAAAILLEQGKMLLNGGQLDDNRLLGSRTVAYISSDHLGALGNPENLAVHGYTPGVGYGGGFGFYARLDAGRSPFLGNLGEFYKGGYAGTVFWVDPKEELIAVLMVCAPKHRLRYRHLIKTLIYQAIME